MITSFLDSLILLCVMIDNTWKFAIFVGQKIALLTVFVFDKIQA